MKSDKKKFKPQNLRSILATLFVALMIFGAISYNYGLHVIDKYAEEVNQRLVDADASGQQVGHLQTLKTQLTLSDSLLDKANQIFAAPATYQAQALRDIKNYADASGLAITNTTFANAGETGTHSIIITLRQPISYSKLISFLHNIEGNLPKMQVSSISLGQPASGGADNVKTGDIKIDISVR